MKNITKLFFLFFLLYSVSGVSAQTQYTIPQGYFKNHDDSLEGLEAKWDEVLFGVKQQVKASDEDFKLFTNFYKTYLDSERSVVFQQIVAGKINYNNIASDLASKELELQNFYAKFLGIKKEYPNSVEEAQAPAFTPVTTQSCVAACSNLNFASGTFSGGWYGYYSTNTSSATTSSIGAVTGGLLGAVVKGAGPDGATQNTYQVHITSSALNDAFLKAATPSILMSEASPWNGTYAAMVGDSTNPNTGVAILSQTFSVSPVLNSITYAYSAILENPSGSHTASQQPFFKITILDGAGNIIPNCGEYDVVSSGGSGKGFKGVWYAKGGDSVYWKNWTQVNVPLDKYIGQCVTIQFETGDCAFTAHFGYAYVAAACVQLAITSSTPVICPNGTATLYGPVGEARYLWSGANSNKGIISNDTLQNIVVDSGGTYTLVVTTFAGALCKDTIHYTEPIDRLKLTATSASVLCNGGTASATANPVNGTSPYTYTWTPSSETTATATGLTIGTYTVTVGDANGCSATASIIITQPPLLTATMGAPTNVLCNGGNNGSATTTVTGGTLPYTYSWNPSGETTGAGTSLTAGTYTVTVEDAHGCISTATVIITQPPLLTVTTGVPINVLCNGGNNGSVTTTVTGGTSPYTYSWNPTGQATANATGLTAASYTITVKDADGCISTATTIITQPPLLTSTIAPPTNILCYGGNNGSATASATGGTLPYTYSWTPSGGNTATAGGLTAGTYTVTVKDKDGCTSTASTIITQPALLSVTIGTPTNVLCNGGNNGSATATVTGGTLPYTYAWSLTGGNNATGTGLIAGTYTVNIKDADGCTASATVIITQPLALSTTTSFTPAYCNLSNGSATVNVSGGTSPYTYSWTPSSETTSTATGISIGTYTVNVKDNNGCTTSTTVTVTQPSAVTVTTGIPINVLCNGGNNGSITTTVTGGTSPYTYSWNPTGQTTTSATGLTAGTYTITVKDVNGCISVATATIIQPPLLTATIAPPTNILCYGGNNGSATASATGGTLPYTYSWTPSGGNTATAGGLTAGTYTVTVIDKDGCISTASTIITQPALLSVTIGTPTNVLCNGGNNGSATATVTGGTLPYTYAWSLTGGNNATGTGLIAGTYTVNIKDADGCAASATVIITQPLALSTTTSFTPAYCNLSNGSATVNVSGGTSPYTYSWTPSSETTSTATGISIGTYTVNVKDNNGCTTSTTVTVTQPSAVTVTTGLPINVLCNGGNNGSVTTNVTGGTPPYTYSWAPTSNNKPDGTSLTAGTYTVTVTDNTGCISVATAIITQPPLLTATMGTPTNVLCNGGNNGSATVTVTGGTLPYTYAWAPRGGNAATAAGLIAGNYTVTVTDADGCTSTASVIITQPPVLTATMGVPTNVLCNGGNNGSATVTVTGGTLPYTYSWATSGGANATANGLTAGTYTVNVTDADGCVSTASVIITQPPVLTATMGVPTNVLCNGGNNGSATVTVTGGTLPYTYLWATSGGANATATGLTAGTYTVTVTDADGCVSTASVIITQPPVLTATMGVATNVLCNGGNNGSATVTVTGGTLPYTYAWAPIGGTNPTGNGLTAGIYTVTVTDAHGCVSIANVTITQPPLLTDAIVSIVNVLCNGGNNGSATSTVTGGTLPYTYAWTPAGGTNPTGTGLTAGIYTLMVTDANGCITTTTTTITQPTALSTTTSSTAAYCNLSDGSATVNVNGGTSPYTYSWTPSGEITATATGISAGIYTVNVIDNNGCTISTTVTVTQPSTVQASIGAITNVSCFGGNNGSITAIATGGPSPYTYSWNPSGETTATATGLKIGTYTVTITDAKGCQSKAVATITQPALLTVNVSGPNTICKGSTGTFTATVTGGTLPYTYAWSTGAITSTASVTPATPQTYSVTITDANGCTTTGQISIDFGPPVYVTVTGQASVCRYVPVTLCGKVTGGTGGTYAYTWQPGNYTTPCITVTPSVTTTYTVTVVDNCGASATASGTVQINPLPFVDFAADIYQGCKPLCIQFYNNSSVSGQSSYSWSFGNGDTALKTNHPIYCYKDSGYYTVTLTVTSDSGCSATRRKINLIHVFGLPDGAFAINPQPTDILSPTIHFTDQTTDPVVNRGLAYWTWIYGDNLDSVGTTQNTMHTYQDTGTYCVRLAVMDRRGCTDTVTNCLIIDPIFTLYIPNAFTPNGDGMDDIFTAKGVYVKDFEMYIFDRWGEQLFHSNDINKGWDGTVHGGTTVSQEDVYVYRILATDWRKHQHVYIGRVTLLK